MGPPKSSKPPAVEQAASDTQTFRQPTKLGGTATAVVTKSAGQLVLTTSGLPALHAGKVYQLWLIGQHGNKIRSEGLLSPHDGRAGPVLVSGLLAGDILGVSVQQAGGAVQPTISTVIVTIPTS